MSTTSNDLNISQSGYVTFDGTATFSGRTFQEGDNISLTNPDGVSGNTTIAASNNHVARYIVSSGGSADGANYTTIASAYAAAVAAGAPQTVFLQPGTYAENITLTPGINLSAFVCDGFTPNVTISGTLTLSSAGTVSISGINLQTDSAACVEVTGASASILKIIDCNINCTNNTGITFSSSSAGARIMIDNCIGDIGTTGIALFSHSSAGSMFIRNSMFTNSGSTTTANTCSSGGLNIDYSFFQNPITTSSTGAGTWRGVTISTTTLNVTAATLNGGTIVLRFCQLSSGTA